MPPFRFLLKKIEENKEFTDEVTVPDMGTLVFSHQILIKEDLMFIKETVFFTPLSNYITEKEFSFFKNVTADITDTVFRLKNVLEQD